ncbi:uncharacterized protein VP01_1447g8 [Puccinia sorghi]|uniref:Uncharacterized protein n=1 Tax=Puccinia sorghi TaxID=27349 RepID=A0A0L6VLZ7_9BASI|nr:uncharacterized protein VP01_1447g8 [Puccinia sorghi]
MDIKLNFLHWKDFSGFWHVWQFLPSHSSHSFHIKTCLSKSQLKSLQPFSNNAKIQQSTSYVLVTYKEQQTQLISKMNQGQSLSPDEEEFLDGKGNLVNAEVLIGQLQTLSSASGHSTEFHRYYSTKKEDKQQAAKEQNKHNPIEKINSKKSSAQKHQYPQTASTTSSNQLKTLSEQSTKKSHMIQTNEFKLSLIQNEIEIIQDITKDYTLW